jgi:hypothetical protein
MPPHSMGLAGKAGREWRARVPRSRRFGAGHSQSARCAIWRLGWFSGIPNPSIALLDRALLIRGVMDDGGRPRAIGRPRAQRLRHGSGLARFGVADPYYLTI